MSLPIPARRRTSKSLSDLEVSTRSLRAFRLPAKGPASQRSSYRGFYDNSSRLCLSHQDPRSKEKLHLQYRRRSAPVSLDRPAPIVWLSSACSVHSIHPTQCLVRPRLPVAGRRERKVSPDASPIRAAWASIPASPATGRRRKKTTSLGVSSHQPPRVSASPLSSAGRRETKASRASTHPSTQASAPVYPLCRGRRKTKPSSASSPKDLLLP